MLIYFRNTARLTEQRKFLIGKHKGFTLIELMVAVGIVGLLAAIAIPSYQESMRKSRRTDAQGALMSFANGMERHYTENSTYCGASQWGGDSCGDGGEMDSGGAPFGSIFAATGKTGDYYDFIIFAVGQNTYTLQAIPKGAQAGNGNLELDQDGSRRWDKNNNGISTEPDENKWE